MDCVLWDYIGWNVFCTKANWNNTMRSILDTKRGELTTTQIVLLVILVASFAIILFFIFRLNLRQETVKEVCHNSVVLRGNAALPGSTTTIPLNCRQAFVCVTTDGTCERMSSYDYRLDVDTKEELYSALAEEMAGCWWTYGEGKVNYVGEEFVSDNYCSICSRLVFDNSIKQELFTNGKIDKTDFYQNYLVKQKMPGKEITYAEYLFGTNDLNAILKASGQIGFGIIDLDKIAEGTNNQLSDYIVVMGISSEVSTLGWTLAGAGTVAVVTIVGVATGGAGLVVGAIIVAGAAAGGAIGGGLIATTVRGLSGNNFLSPTIIPFPSKEYEGLKCADINTLS